MKEKPLVSIITVNFNQTEVTGEFLDSVRRLTYPNCEVIVVDNGSSDSPGPAFQRQHPEVRYIESGENLGFSGGNNLGIRAARGDYFLFVNNDTELTEDLVDRLVGRMRSDSGIGMVCPLIRYFDRSDIIQYAGYTKMNPVTARNATVGQYEVDRGQFRGPRETPFAHGAAMFTSREVIGKVGPMPELFFLYYEELDWSSRIRRAGYRIVVEPSAVVFHKESLSVGRMSPMKTYYMTRNRILFMRRNAPAWSLILFLLYWSLAALPLNALRHLLRGRFDHVGSLFRGTFWHLGHPSGVRKPAGQPGIGALT